ncbi:DUF2269 family protein [Candidatus Azambacteria bacterium]|nr:DUF2269 family protein [Candidatus Azambacteria bacterium]
MHELYDLIHILGVTLFFGGMIISVKWLFLAEMRTRAGTLQTAVQWTHRITIFVTAPGIALIIVSGILQTAYMGNILTQSWLVAGLILFTLSVLVWLIFFIPYHNKLFRIIAHSDDVLPPDFFIVLHRLYFFGVIIIMLPLGTMALSIIKPDLW